MATYFHHTTALSLPLRSMGPQPCNTVCRCRLPAAPGSGIVGLRLPHWASGGAPATVRAEQCPETVEKLDFDDSSRIILEVLQRLSSNYFSFIWQF
jgi:hypothetical protein